MEKQILEMNGAADSRYYACSLQELSRNDFAFTKLDNMNEAYHYWSGHGRNKCSPACLKLPGPLPNNCGFHPQFKFPAQLCCKNIKIITHITSLTYPQVGINFARGAKETVRPHFL